MKLRLYIDEDSMSHALVVALRSRGVDVLTPLDVGTTGWTDAEQLQFASEAGCAIFSFNVGDFVQLHSVWQIAGRDHPHAGIILAQQQQFSVGELMRRLLRLVAAKTAEAMLNQVEFLSVWS